MISARLREGHPRGSTVVKALCLDLDGTIRRPKGDREFIEGPDDVELFPDVAARLAPFAAKRDEWIIVAVTNQAGVAYGHKTVKQVVAETEATLLQIPDDVRRAIFGVYCAYDHERGTVEPFNRRSLLRKPGYGMLAVIEAEASDNGYLIDWDNSLFVGDRYEDAQCATSAGVPFHWADDFFARPHHDRKCFACEQDLSAPDVARRRMGLTPRRYLCAPCELVRIGQLKHPIQEECLGPTYPA